MGLLKKVWGFTCLVALVVADFIIMVMRATRKNERRVKATERISWRKGLKNELMSRQSNTCSYCGSRRIARSMDIDHMTPVVRGGSNDDSNLQVICSPCNQRKGMMTDTEFRERYARLVPGQSLTPPATPVPQSDFRTETKRTEQPDTVKRFKSTRFISNREKVRGGCLLLGIGTSVFFLLGLAAWTPMEGMALLLGSLIPGGAFGGGVYMRAYLTGMTED